MKKQTWSTQKLILTGMLAAIAGVLMSLEVSVPMMPPFYKLDFSDVPSVIALFTVGPISAACVELIKILIKLFTVGTNSMYVGEFANVIGIVLYILPTWLIYKLAGKDKKAIKIALIASIFIRTLFSCFVNAYISLPLYAKANSISMDAVIAFVGSVNSKITSLPTFIMFATIPFNILKNGANFIIGYFLYDRLMKTNEVKKLNLVANK